MRLCCRRTPSVTESPSHPSTLETKPLAQSPQIPTQKSSLKSLAPPSPPSFPSLGQIVSGLICFIYQTIKSLFSQIKQIFIEEPHLDPITSRPLIISPPPTLRPTTPGLPLTISSDDHRKIHTLIKDLATNNLAILLLHSARLKEIGTELNHVHPYLFLVTIFSDPSSCHHMQKIHQDSTSLFRSRIWNDFIRDVSNTLANCKDLENYRDSFAQLLNVNPLQIQLYEKKRQWKELITYLVTGKSTT